jgi:hypothetical protein
MGNSHFSAKSFTVKKNFSMHRKGATIRFAVVPTMTRLDLIVSECKNYGIDCGYGTGTSESAIISSSDASSRFCSFFFRQTEISEVRKYF